jgi:hypothetical protein
MNPRAICRHAVPGNANLLIGGFVGARRKTPIGRLARHGGQAFPGKRFTRAHAALALLFALAAFTARTAAAQGTVGFGDAYSFISHHADPAACVAGNVEFNLSTATPKYCSAPNTWTPFAMGGSGGASGTVNSGAQFAFGEYTSSGTAIGSGPTPPTTNGEYFCGYNVTASIAVAPTCWLNSLTPRAVTGTAATDTILFSDAIVEYQGSAAVATALPTPATLGNAGFYAKLVNTTSGSATAVTLTAAGAYTFSSTGTGTLVIAQGQSCSLLADPAGSVWDDTCGDLPLTAGANISITRGRFGPTISATGAGVSSFTGDGTFATNSASTGGVTLALANAGAYKFWGNNTGSTAAPGYFSIPAAAIPTLNQSTTGNAATATALAATPSQCSGSQFAQGIAASGNANCATPAGSSFNAATVTLFDDFVSSTIASSLGWADNGGGGSMQAQPTSAGEQFANHPGIMALNSGGTSGGTDWEYYILGSQNNPQINPTASSFTIYADFANNGGTSGAVIGTIRFGLFDSTSMNAESPHSAIYFEAVGTGGGAPTWNCVVNTAGTPTSASSGVTAPVGSGTFHVLELVFTASSSVTFMIDGSTVCSGLSATVPSALMNSAFEATDNSSGAASILIDYFREDMNLTR